jgi:hypothetical protein
MFDNIIKLHTKVGCSQKIKIIHSDKTVPYDLEALQLFNSLISLPHGTMVELKKLINERVSD